MKIVEIKRKQNEFKGTLGVLSIDKVEFCQTLELPWVDEDGNLIGDKNKSCINSGAYIAKIVISPKFGRVFEVTGVKDRTHILIHPANRIYEIKGCIALGFLSGNRDGENLVFKSRDAFNKFMEIMKDDKEFELRIS